MRIRSGIFAVSAVGLFVGIVQGCATEVVTVEDDDSGTTPVVDAAKPDSNTSKPDSNVPDSAKPDSSKADTSTPDSTTVDAADAAIGPKPGDPFDPLAPKTGDTCPTGVMENDVVTRRCGKCGSQNALCEAGRKVGMYGACSGEKTNADACLPGERLVNSCGFCGQQIKNCDNTCSYIEGACQNQVANGCTANEVTYIEGVCAVTTDVRRQVCSAACVKPTPEACAPRPLDEITVSQTANMTVTGNFQTTGSLKLPLLTGTACPATESASTSSLYHYVRLKNNGADEVTVTVSNGIPVGSTRPAVTMAAYAGATIPTDRKACSVAPFTASPESLRFAIPAGGSVIVHTMLDSASATQAKLALEVKTNFVGPETAPAPDHILTIGATSGTTVTQAVQFVNTQTLSRVNTFPSTCPTTFSSLITAYRYIRLVNPTATDKLVDVSGDDPQDTVLTIYPGANGPISTARAGCQVGTNDTCPAAAGIASADSCLTGVTVPANGSVVVYFAEYFDDDFDATTLRVTTKN